MPSSLRYSSLKLKATHYPECCSVLTKLSLHHILLYSNLLFHRNEYVFYSIVINVFNKYLLIIMFNNVKVPFFHDMLHALSVTISLHACYIYLSQFSRYCLVS
jgi:hypothetical protein